MERLLKYYLSLYVIIALSSCQDKAHDNLSLVEKKELSFQVFNDGGQLPQGSSKSMTRIEKAIEIDPNNCDAVRELSVAYLKRGLAHKWKPQFDKAVACNPEIWQPMRGYLYLSFYRDYKKAIADFDASDILTPNFIDAPQGHSVDYWRGMCYLGLKDYKNSIAYLDKYVQMEIDESGEDWVEVTAFMYRGIAYFESGNYEEALINFDKQLQYSRDMSADAKYYKAQIFKKQGEIEEAQSMIGEAITDYNSGYYNNRPYVEILRQIYIEDLEAFKAEIQ